MFLARAFLFPEGPPAAEVPTDHFHIMPGPGSPVLESAKGPFPHSANRNTIHIIFENSGLVLPVLESAKETFSHKWSYRQGIKTE